MRRTLPLIFSPVSGRGRLLKRLPRVRAKAEELGFDLRLLKTRAPGHATELAARCAAEDEELVFAYGGDGTYNEVAAGLLGTSTAMAMLPGGTTSVLAYELEIPRAAELALEALLGGEDRPMRCGRTDRGQLFLMMLSAGPDSVVLDRLDTGLKLRGGKLAIALQALRELGRGSVAALRATAGSWSETGGWAIVGNIRCYGGPYHATPGADPFSDDLELVLQRGIGWRAAVPFFFGIARGRHLERRDVVRRRVRRLRLETAVPGERVPYQIDGDPAGELPVEISVAPESLWVRLPLRPGA